MDAESGTRIHTVIAALATSRPTVDELIAHVHDAFRGHPIGGTTQQSARLRCVTATAVYFNDFAPGPGWHLVGSEIDVGGAIADLVWRHDDGRVVIDEIKAGRARPGRGDQIDDQLLRLAAGGRRRWRARFCGVRACTLATPGRAGMFIADAGRLTRTAFPDGMAVR